MRDNRGVAGYSSTPLARKLGIRAGDRVALIGAPEGFTGLLEGLPPGVTFLERPRGAVGVIVLFVRARVDLDRRAAPLAALLEPRGGLWLAWQKRASGVVADVGEHDLRAHGLALGLVDNKVCAVDETWSAMRFVRRVRTAPPAQAPAPALPGHRRSRGSAAEAPR